MVDYYISGVRHDETKITHLKVHSNINGKLGTGQIWARMDVVNAIDLQQKSFKTVIKNNGQWVEGQEVHVVKIKDNKFLRTDQNRIAADNLGNLPPV